MRPGELSLHVSVDLLHERQVMEMVHQAVEENERLRAENAGLHHALSIQHDLIGRLAWSACLAERARKAFRRLDVRHGFEFLRLIRNLGGAR